MRETKTEILSDFDSMDQIERSKFVDNNTVEIILQDGTQIIRYHHTDIITVKPETLQTPNPPIIFNSGGWHTMSTRERMSNYAPGKLQLWQNDHIWYVGIPGWNSHEEKSYVFYDGIMLDKYGNLLSRERKINERRRKRLKKMIREYVALLDTMDKIPIPNGGDCWYCSMMTDDGKPLGEALSEDDHILMHVKQKYIFGSILVNAMREFGYHDQQIAFHFHTNEKWAFKHALRRYLTRRLLT